MADIQSAAAEIRLGKKEERKIDRRKKQQHKNIMPLLHRAAIINRERYRRDGRPAEHRWRPLFKGFKA